MAEKSLFEAVKCSMDQTLEASSVRHPDRRRRVDRNEKKRALWNIGFSAAPQTQTGSSSKKRNARQLRAHITQGFIKHRLK
jgi:hypothetical protein